MNSSLTLQETQSIHDSMNIPKIEFISELNVNKCKVPLDAHFEIKWYAGKRIYYEFDIRECSVSVVDCLT